MDSGSTSGSLVGKGKKVEKTRCSWSAHEEEVLIQALKDVINKGWKSENGFRAGYLTLLENAMRAAIPGTNIRGNPHINSKVHVWKKTHGTLVTILSKSGVGWNDSDKTIEATDEVWETIIQSDHTTRSMRHKQWPYYQDWCDIFGNDWAIGEHAKTFTSALQDVLNMDYEVENDTTDGGDGKSMSATHTLSSKPSVGATFNSKKRKHVNEGDDAIVEVINNLATITKDTMKDLTKELATEEKISNAQEKVLDALMVISELTEEEKVLVAELLADNYNKLSLFLRLNDKGKLSLAKRLLRGG
ncbi:uncharacterized protein At2g29880-like [Zingiber officinale]|uniref:uncharacterized protein At2g29880-like n=1 Tax=Zingiber officinale TaxID=94328 RepID=UPI001C4C75B8|nr:uncharacterized protein At2g29880-like [Zingiber officinale]